MAEYSFKDMLDAAKASGSVSDSPPDGEYDIKVERVSDSHTKKGDPRFSLLFKVVGGPQDGKSFWEGFNFIADNPKATAITFRNMASFGVGHDFWATNPSTEEIKERLLSIPQFNASVKFTQSGDFTNVRFSKVKLSETGGGSVPTANAAPASAPSAGTAPTF